MTQMTKMPMMMTTRWRWWQKCRWWQRCRWWQYLCRLWEELSSEKENCCDRQRDNNQEWRNAYRKLCWWWFWWTLWWKLWSNDDIMVIVITLMTLVTNFITMVNILKFVTMMKIVTVVMKILTIMTSFGRLLWRGHGWWLLIIDLSLCRKPKSNQNRHLSPILKWLFSQSISDLQDLRTQLAIKDTIFTKCFLHLFFCETKKKQRFTESPRVSTSNVTFQLGPMILRTHLNFCNLTRKGRDVLHLRSPPPKNQHRSDHTWRDLD